MGRFAECQGCAVTRRGVLVPGSRQPWGVRVIIPTSHRARGRPQEADLSRVTSRGCHLIRMSSWGWPRPHAEVDVAPFCPRVIDMKSVPPCMFLVPAASENQFTSLGSCDCRSFSWAASWALHATSRPCPVTFSVPVPGYWSESLRDLRVGSGHGPLSLT